MRPLFRIVLSLSLMTLWVGGAEARMTKEIRAHFSGAELPLPATSALNLSLKKQPATIGLVSWYGPGFHGHRTANGERYNMHAFTCASRDLPFGTMLELTNVANGEKAVVRVNDRGPYYRWRILDLSYAAAKKLGFTRSGQAKVEVRRINGEKIALEQ